VCAISSLTSTFAISSPDEFLYKESRKAEKVVSLSLCTSSIKTQK